MKRVEELTLKLIDSGLTPDEQAELDVLHADETALQDHLRLVALEAALRGEGRIPDVVAATLRQVNETRSTDLERFVMRVVATLPTPTEPKAKKRRFWRAAALCAMAAAVLLLMLRERQIVRPPDVEPVSGPWAMLLDSTPDVVVEGVDGPTKELSLSGQPTIRTTAEDGYALVQFYDGTRVELFGRSAVTLSQTASDGKCVRLLEGSMKADVRPQPSEKPLVVETPHAELRVLGTRFGVTTMAEEGTRVQMESGKVSMKRGEEPATELTAGASAYVPSEAKPIVLQDRPKVLHEPDRNFSFAGLRHLLFAPDGQTVIGLTGRQAVYWQLERDRMEAIPMGSESRKGNDLTGWAGPVVAMGQPHHPRLELWDVVRRESKRLGPNSDPKLTLAAISPRGDWWAYWNSLKTGVRVWRAGEAKPIEVTYPGKLASIGVSPDGRLLALGRQEKVFVVDLIETATGRLAARLEPGLPSNRKMPLSLTFSEDGKRLAVGRLGRLEVWDVETKLVLAAIDHPVCDILRLALSPDGRHVAAAAQDDWVWLWEVANPTEPLGIRVGQPARGLAFAPDGRSLAVLDKNSRIILWNLPN